MLPRLATCTLQKISVGINFRQCSKNRHVRFCYAIFNIGQNWNSCQWEVEVKLEIDSPSEIFWLYSTLWAAHMSVWGKAIVPTNKCPSGVNTRNILNGKTIVWNESRWICSTEITWWLTSPGIPNTRSSSAPYACIHVYVHTWTLEGRTQEEREREREWQWLRLLPWPLHGSFVSVELEWCPCRSRYFPQSDIYLSLPT